MELVEEDEENSHRRHIAQDEDEQSEKRYPKRATIGDFLVHHPPFKIPSHEHRDKNSADRHAELTHNPVAEVEDGTSED